MKRLQSSSNRAGAAAVAMALALPAALLGWGFWGYSHDDAFITYRYADQWARGNGLTFNTGEHILGTSAPGYALLLGLLSRATGFVAIGVPEWGTLLSLAAILLIAWALTAALSGASVSARLGVPLLFGIGALLWRWNIEMLGSEAFLVVALVAWGAYGVFWKDSFVLGGLALAGAMILRLDAGLAAASLGTVLWLSRRRFPWKFAIAGVAPVAPWLAGLYSRFGTLLPTTLAGKHADYTAASGAYSLAEWQWLRRSLPLSGCLVLVALAVLGAALCAKRGVWKHPAVLALGLWLLSHEVAYRAVRVPFAPWYHEGLVHAVGILAVFGAVALGQSLLIGRSAERQVLPALAAGLLLLPVLVPSLAYVVRQWRRPPDPRFEIYRTIGVYLAERARPRSTVAAVEVGIVGYFSRLPVLDLSGLVTPDVIQAKSQGRLKQLVTALKPDYVLDVPTFRANVLAFLSEPGMLPPYRVVREFRSPDEDASYRVVERVRDP